ncbi:hypothetical protein FOZ63_016502, partial [Perkinsus olseni]
SPLRTATAFRSSVMIFSSPTPSVSRRVSMRRPATPSSLRSTRSVPSPSPSRPITRPSAPDGLSWFLIAPVRPRIPLSLISSSASAPARSRLVLPAVPRGCASTTSSCVLKKSLAPRLPSPAGRTSLAA